MGCDYKVNTIELVTHSYSPDEVPIYHRLLQLQLGSLLLHHPSINTVMSICYTSEDKKTSSVVDWFQKEIEKIPSIHLKKFILEKENLFRRAIGRNIAAKTSWADVIWFTDCDYLFNSASTLLLAHIHCLRSDKNIVYPQTVNTNTLHSLGDAYVEKMKDLPPHIVEINSDHFMRKNYRKAIGGIQITKGLYCREHGYLDNTKWVKPVDASKGFRSCKGDVPFRRGAGGSEGVDIPGVFRVRHSFCGRDGGAKNHGKKL